MLKIYFGYIGLNKLLKLTSLEYFKLHRWIGGAYYISVGQCYSKDWISFSWMAIFSTGICIEPSPENSLNLLLHIEVETYNKEKPEFQSLFLSLGFPDGTMVKNPPTNAGDTRNGDSIPGSGRSPGEGNGNPLQYSCLENSMDRRVWQAMVHKVSKSQTWLKQLSTHTHIKHFGMKTVLMRDFQFLKFSLWQFSSIDYPLILSSSFSKQCHLKIYNKGTFQGKFKFLKFLLDSRESWSGEEGSV